MAISVGTLQESFGKMFSCVFPKYTTIKQKRRSRASNLTWTCPSWAQTCWLRSSKSANSMRSSNAIRFALIRGSLRPPFYASHWFLTPFRCLLLRRGSHQPRCSRGTAPVAWTIAAGAAMGTWAWLLLFLGLAQTNLMRRGRRNWLRLSSRTAAMRRQKNSVTGWR